MQAGGGIVADSDPLGEYHETLVKARALLEAIAQASAASAPQGTYRPAGEHSKDRSGIV